MRVQLSSTLAYQVCSKVSSRVTNDEAPISLYMAAHRDTSI